MRFDPDLAMDETIGETADDGARIVDVDVIDERTRDLTIESPSVGYAKARLLLPEGFDEGGDDAWPVLYLLQGAFDDYTSWTRETDVEELDDLSDVLVVMPDAGSIGYYSDWWHGGAGGVPAWETFHLEELTQLLERNWQAGDDRVIAGLSMGGFGAMSYAARHPGMFGAAASYSGVLDTVGSDSRDRPGPVGRQDRTGGHLGGAQPPEPGSTSSKGTPLYVSWGNGEPGPLDEPGWSDDGTRGLDRAPERGLRGAARRARDRRDDRRLRRRPPHLAVLGARAPRVAADAPGGPRPALTLARSRP